MFDTILLFIFGLLLLIKGGDWFVDSASGVAQRFKIPELLIGATIVSIGTTLPEVMVSAQSAALGQGELAYGNAIGSIICNTALIAALTIAIRPPQIERKTFILPVIFFFIAALLYVVIAYATGNFSRVVGIALLGIFVLYMGITIYNAVKASKKEKELIGNDAVNVEPAEQEVASIGVLSIVNECVLILGALLYFILSFISSLAALVTAIAVLVIFIAIMILDKFYFSRKVGKEVVLPGALALVKQIVFLVIGAAVIALGANLLVDNGTAMAKGFGVPESVIGLTFVAVGTSLPELVTAITSLVKKHGSLSLGNIIGANLFNLVFVSGVSITIAPFAIPTGNMIGSMPMSLVIDLPVMLFVMMFLTLPAIIRGKLSRWQGISLLAVYAAFCTLQFVL